MIRILVAVGAGYVLGTKAGRRRYEQISGVARAVVESPATKAAIDTGRRKLSEALSTEPKFTKIEPIDERTSIYIPEDKNRRD